MIARTVRRSAIPAKTMPEREISKDQETGKSSEISHSMDDKAEKMALPVQIKENAGARI